MATRRWPFIAGFSLIAVQALQARSRAKGRSFIGNLASARAFGP